MKKRTIWTIAVVMGFSFLALLFLQLKYMDAMIKMKKEQLDESVNKALYQAARNLELNETLRYLERDVNETERRAYKNDSNAALKRPDVIYLDPMFPERQKSGLVKKKFQLIHYLEAPAENEEALMQAAIAARPLKIVVKRPAKGPYLAGLKPSYSLDGKAIRYDCYVFPENA